MGATVINFNNFDEVFDFNPDYSYDEEMVLEIENNRKGIQGLFIDRIMKLMGIKRRKEPVVFLWRNLLIEM